MNEDKGTQTTWEEASRCPRCGHPGHDIATRPTQRRGTMAHTLRCESSELCPWYNTTWVVNVNEDGSIPAPYSQVGPKAYPRVSQETLTRIDEAIGRQLEAEKRGDGEVRNPHSR